MYVHIQINDVLIKTYGAQNITGKSTGVNSYRVCKYENGNRVFLSGMLFHTYEDGAVVLAKKILDFVMIIEEAGLSE